MNTFGQGFPDPLQSVVNHAERLSVALGLTETDQRRFVDTGPREPGLSELWLVGRAVEVEVFVADVIYDWRVGDISAKGAAAVIECYLLRIHREMESRAGLRPPTCCSSNECVTVDLGSALASYPPVVPPRRLPRPPPPPMLKAWVQVRTPSSAA